MHHKLIVGGIMLAVILIYAGWWIYIHAVMLIIMGFGVSFFGFSMLSAVQVLRRSRRVPQARTEDQTDTDTYDTSAYLGTEPGTMGTAEMRVRSATVAAMQGRKGGRVFDPCNWE